MCSSPKACVTSRSKTVIAPGSTQLSAAQQTRYADKANAAWERRELRRLQRQATKITAPEEPGVLEKFWQRLVRLGTKQPAIRSHSAQ
ncbi:hypothetical protein [Amphritea sp.]|uniref:hypothetical protein n=1 Tax=Amphritea sp. TaxID=1872502 RepID=UPI0025BDA961|nr:hypothetical protein [Amphritea sp.]